MQYTEHLSLYKPDESEQYNIDHFNENSEILDKHIHNLETGADDLRSAMESGDAESRKFQNMEGVCQISQGGTGKTTAQDALNNLHGGVQAADALSEVDEFLFLRRTHEDVAQGIPESLDTKSVLLDELAKKIFSLMSGNQQGAVSYGIFSPTANGFAPKSGNNNGTKFLNALGQWAEPQGKTEVHEVTESGGYDINVPTILRIKGNSTVLVRDPSVFGVPLTVFNETARAQLVSLRLNGGSVSYRLNKGGIWRLMWNGSHWIPAGDEPQCGDLKYTYAAEAPEGWFMCDGTDTTGTAEELETCYPNLFDLVGGNILPDWRECSPVGAGKNTRETMAAHEEYEVGQFKDDQAGNHTHTRGTMEISGTLMDMFGCLDSPPCRGDGAFSTSPVKRRFPWPEPGVIGAWYANFRASRSWSGATSVPNGGRAGEVTRGKRRGCNIMIKA